MSEPQSGIQPNVNASEIPSTEKISPNPAASKEAVVPKTATTWSSLQTKWTRFQTGRTYRTYSWTTKNRGKVLLGATALFYGVTYLSSRRRAAKRDKVHDSTYLYWKVYDGSIVEAKGSANAVANLVLGSSGGSDEPARVLTLYEVVRGLNAIKQDVRIKGLIADFSTLAAPIVQSPYTLGLAQIEEIANAIEDLNISKAETLGAENWRSIALTDTFESQAHFALASAFNEIYLQPTGEVPLTGVGSQLPFFKRIIDWLGIKVQAEAREEYKSFIAQYTSERLSEPQTANQQELLHSLNDLMLERIGRNRFGRVLPEIKMVPLGEPTAIDEVDALPSPGRNDILPDSSKTPARADAATKAVTILQPDEGILPSPAVGTLEEKILAALGHGTASTVVNTTPLNTATPSYLEQMRRLVFDGPFSATEAAEKGLVTGLSYRSYILDSITDSTYGGSEDNKLMGFYHYCKLVEAGVEKPMVTVGVVYLMGTIGETGDFDAASVIRGLRQAGEDDSIQCVVLRVDSGGGGVVDSDSIDQAVRDLREKKGKIVIASFSNAAASGGYLSACHADAILANAATITGSIGVAALRPTITPSFLDKIKVSVQSILTGSPANDLTQELSGKHLERYQRHVDEMYADFKNRVVEGREIHPELINSLAGGRVYTGQMAFDLLADYQAQTSSNSRTENTSSLSQVIEGTAGSAIIGVQIAEDQETSSFAPPDLELPANTVENPDTKQSLDSLAVTPNAPQNPTSDVTDELGPLGRGIIDGLGGLQDASMLGIEVLVKLAVAELKEEHPNPTPDQILAAIARVAPGAECSVNEAGDVSMNVTHDIKQFPVEKSFWQLIRDASGPEMTDPHAFMPRIGAVATVILAEWIRSAARQAVAGELDQLGLADVRRSMGLGFGRRGRMHMRAEVPRWVGYR